MGSFPLLLAPMEDVSDPPFRALCKENGADVVYTEFISSEGLIRNAAKSIQKLDIYEKERPVGIQIFGANIDSMMRSNEIVEKNCVIIVGESTVLNKLPVSASNLYSKNIFNFINNLFDNTNKKFDINL